MYCDGESEFDVLQQSFKMDRLNWYRSASQVNPAYAESDFESDHGDPSLQ